MNKTIQPDNYVNYDMLSLFRALLNEYIEKEIGVSITLEDYKKLSEEDRQSGSYFIVDADNSNVIDVLDTLDAVRQNEQANKFAGALALKELLSKVPYLSDEEGDEIAEVSAFSLTRDTSEESPQYETLIVKTTLDEDNSVYNLSDLNIELSEYSTIVVRLFFNNTALDSLIDTRVVRALGSQYFNHILYIDEDHNISIAGQVTCSEIQFISWLVCGLSFDKIEVYGIN